MNKRRATGLLLEAIKDHPGKTISAIGAVSGLSWLRGRSTGHDLGRENLTREMFGGRQRSIFNPLN